MQKSESLVQSNNLHPYKLYGRWDYPSFGAPASHRDKSRSRSNAYRAFRYGFNGKEKDFETANDDFPNAIWIGARIYDGRLWRWRTVLNLAIPIIKPTTLKFYSIFRIKVTSSDSMTSN